MTFQWPYPARMIAKRMLRTTQALGFSIIPNHFYEPVPVLADLPEKIFESVGELPGLDMQDEAQCRLIMELARYREEYSLFDSKREKGLFTLDNETFGPVDAEVLHAMLRARAPRKMIEIGSGNSTLIEREALAHNRSEGKPCRLQCIEPFPPAFLKQVEGIELIQEKAEKLPMSLFQSLDSGDVLFIDSSHILRTGSDVQYEFLEIIPRLNKGVLVHVHDIFLPMEYPKNWIMDSKVHRFFNEQYILQSFLAFNDSFRIVWAGAYMHLRHPDLLRGAFPSYARRGGLPGSFWFEKVK